MQSSTQQPIAVERPVWRHLLFGLLLIAFVLPYWLDTWWKFIPSSVLMVSLMRALSPAQYRPWLGLRLSGRALAMTVGLLLAFHLLARVVILQSVESQQVLYMQDWHPLGWRFTHLFQALNEEMLFRGLLLGAWMRSWNRPGTISVLTAIVFSLAHLAFYALNNGEVLAMSVLATLFAFGLASNWLYIRFGHIGFSYALHAGWNTVRFTAIYVPFARNDVFSEAKTFNLIEGSGPVLALALGVLGVSAACLYRRPRQTASATNPPEGQPVS
jgi:membrane protease YdiL (CAAX protease family)